MTCVYPDNECVHCEQPVVCQPGTEAEVTGQRSLKAASERRLGVKGKELCKVSFGDSPLELSLTENIYRSLQKAHRQGVCQAMNWDRCKVLRRWLLSALGKPGESGRLKPSWEGMKAWLEGGIKEAHS